MRTHVPSPIYVYYLQMPRSRFLLRWNLQYIIPLAEIFAELHRGSQFNTLSISISTFDTLSHFLHLLRDNLLSRRSPLSSSSCRALICYIPYISPYSIHTWIYILIMKRILLIIISSKLSFFSMKMKMAFEMLTRLESSDRRRDGPSYKP